MKANIKLAIFDFDGTIADTKITIVEAKRKTSILLGLEPVSDEEWKLADYVIDSIGELTNII